MYSTTSAFATAIAFAGGAFFAWRTAVVNKWNGWQFVTCLLIVEGGLAIMHQAARHWH